MKKKTFNFLDIGNVLGRSEMKKLMAGQSSRDCNGKVCVHSTGKCDAESVHSHCRENNNGTCGSNVCF